MGAKALDSDLGAGGFSQYQKSRDMRPSKPHGTRISFFIVWRLSVGCRDFPAKSGVNPLKLVEPWWFDRPAR
jgi:hypothetical protein